MKRRCSDERRWAARLAFAFVLPCLAVACASTSLSLPDTQQRIERYIGSGDYDSEFGAVVARARAYLEKRAPQVTKPAIVLDIDETSLTNWPAYRANGWARITA
ncbi:MAG TPA: HAD family acid phosphatase, partial [Gammaproteobacteria bacterium]|nr:HAD family acid phosphatase [Gammaproteobacteria bacterium]